MANADLWVFSEKPGLLAELISAACGLAGEGGGKVVALTAGPRAEAETAIARGADRVLWLGEVKPGGMVEDFVPTIADAVKEQPPALILIGSTRRGKAVAGRLAARLGTSALTDVLQFERSNGALQAKHMIFGGGAVRTDRALAGTVVATVGPGVFTAASAQPGRTGEIVEVPFVAPPLSMTVRERRPLPKASVNLSAARKIVSAGRGVAKKEDLGMVEELAGLLGAEVACTRPLAEGLDWLPRERYIGISGATVKPDLYLGVGVSGQVQHQIGMNGSRVVVAINKDSGAPIFSNADYAIAADLYQVVPALIDVLKRRK